MTWLQCKENIYVDMYRLALCIHQKCNECSHVTVTTATNQHGCKDNNPSKAGNTHASNLYTY